MEDKYKYLKQSIMDAVARANPYKEMVAMSARGGGKNTLYEDWQKAKDKYIIDNLSSMTKNPSKSFPGAVTPSVHSSTLEKLNTVSKEDEKRISLEIGEIRNKISDLVTGENQLAKFLQKQTIREMIRELRKDVKNLKEEFGLKESDIVKILEEEYIRNKEDDYDNVPF